MKGKIVSYIVLDNVRTWNAGSAVDKDEDHAAEGPSDAEDADAIASVGAGLTGIGLAAVANHSQYGDIEKKKSGNELGNEGPVKGPLAELRRVEQRRRRRVVVVLAGEPSRGGGVVFGHNVLGKRVTEKERD